MKKKGKNKIIYDIVHGYIEITQDMMMIVDSQSFQRLKYISQMTANHLYPSANHTRFEHSLGVMKLAEDFFNKLKDTLLDNIKKENSTNSYNIINDLKIHLLYAALLHDVGHAPLSHLGEGLYDIDGIEENIKNYGINLSSIEKGSAHEKMSCLVIVKNLKDKLDKIYSFDYELICRIITGTYYSGDFWYKDIIISIVNSKTIDVDKLDYLLRDNFMTGKVGPEIDIKRLIESVAIFRKKLVFSKMGLSSIQKVIDCRDSIYLWVCNHHTVVYTDYIYMEILKHMISLYDWYEVPLNINMDRFMKLCHENKYTGNQIDIIINNYSKSENTYIIDRDKITDYEKAEIVSILKKVKYLPYPEAISKNELFSCDAITERMVTDNEALYFIKRAMNLSRLDSTSFYSKILVNQLLNRSFLKPVWKTIFEFKEYMNEFFDSSQIVEVINLITNGTKRISSEDVRSMIVNYLIKETKSNMGELFLIVRLNNFYQKKLSNLYIYINNKNKPINELLPQRNYDELYSEVAFYIFCKKDKQEEVKTKFSSIFNDNVLNIL